ncbi:MAG TPA: retropepsin-like aspartic protease [Flavobacteriaceae bacterium]|nr:retropepsin-like aspartic protease [Flavobacteriaceae bacterium]
MKTLRAFLEEKNFIRVPLQKVNSNHFKIKAKINGVSGDFILDTGASNSCLGLHIVEKFKLLAHASEVKASGAGATGMDTFTSVATKVSIGAWTAKNMEFVVFDMTHVNEALTTAGIASVDGIIGAEMLKKARAVIDYGRNCVYLK